jgi:hypothetical protein
MKINKYEKNEKNNIMKEPLKVTINDKYENAYPNRIIILVNC